MTECIVNGVTWTDDEVRSLAGEVATMNPVVQVLHQIGAERPGESYDYETILARLQHEYSLIKTQRQVAGSLGAYSRLIARKYGKPEMPLIGLAAGGIAWPITVERIGDRIKYTMPVKIAEWWRSADVPLRG